ncbi:MAG: PIN domain-containing protein [Candidatus Diapherotrites archaeon]
MVAERVFVDSNIFLDYYFDRKDSIKPLGEFAFQFFNNAVSCKYFLIIPKDVVFEIKNILNCNESHLQNTVFKELLNAKKIEFIDSSDTQVEEARKISKKFNIPKTDSLCAVLARDYGAIVVSRDKHFEKLNHITKSFLPEEL